jgi:hypothetical protein
LQKDATTNPIRFIETECPAHQRLAKRIRSRFVSSKRMPVKPYSFSIRFITTNANQNPQRQPNAIRLFVLARSAIR